MVFRSFSIWQRIKRNIYIYICTCTMYRVPYVCLKYNSWKIHSVLNKKKIKFLIFVILLSSVDLTCILKMLPNSWRKYWYVFIFTLIFKSRWLRRFLDILYFFNDFIWIGLLEVSNVVNQRIPIQHWKKYLSVSFIEIFKGSPAFRLKCNL